jgi:hypothetical protein
MTSSAKTMELLKARVQSGDIRISDALTRILPKLRGIVTDDTLIWCSNELQGYPNALDFYQRKYTDLPPYRVVAGVLKVVRSDGQLVGITHPLAERNQHFLSAPIGWIEDFYSLPGEMTVVEFPELTKHIGAGGTIVCQCTKTQLRRITNSVKDSLILLIDQVAMGKPAGLSAAAGQPRAIFVVPGTEGTKPQPMPPAAPQAPKAPTPSTFTASGRPTAEFIAALDREEFRVSTKGGQPIVPQAPQQSPSAEQPVKPPQAVPPPEPSQTPPPAKPAHAKLAYLSGIATPAAAQPSLPQPPPPPVPVIPGTAPPAPAPVTAAPSRTPADETAPPNPVPTTPASEAAMPGAEFTPAEAEQAELFAVFKTEQKPAPQPAAQKMDPLYQTDADPDADDVVLYSEDLGPIQASVPPPQPQASPQSDAALPQPQAPEATAEAASMQSAPEPAPAANESPAQTYLPDADDELSAAQLQDLLEAQMQALPPLPGESVPTVEQAAPAQIEPPPPFHPAVDPFKPQRLPSTTTGFTPQNDPFAGMQTATPFGVQPPDQYSTGQFGTIPQSAPVPKPQFSITQLPLSQEGNQFATGQQTPVQDADQASQGQKLKAKSLDLMKTAYLAKDWVIPTWTFSLTGPQQERDFNKAVISNMLSAGWARAGSAPNVFLLTDAGAREVEKLLAGS